MGLILGNAFPIRQAASRFPCHPAHFTGPVRGVLGALRLNRYNVYGYIDITTTRG